jgi:hypothetical protein
MVGTDIEGNHFVEDAKVVDGSLDQFEMKEG